VTTVAVAFTRAAPAGAPALQAVEIGE